MGNPSGEKPNNDYSDEVIEAKAEIAFKVRLDWYFKLKSWNKVLINWLVLADKKKPSKTNIQSDTSLKIKERCKKQNNS